jgi:methionyl-tRNA formyltransferase
MAGDAETGATVFQLTPGLDDGEWYAQHRERIDNDSTAGALLEHLSDVGARLTASVVDDLARGAAQRHVQEGEVTVAPKLERDDGRLRWTHDASAVLARWRGVTPEPGAWTSTEQGLIVKVLALTPAADAAPRPSGELYLDGRRVLVGTRSVPLELTRVQPAGKQQMSASDWARGWGPTIPRLA